MEEIASGFPLKEQEMIRPRTLEGEKDGIVGQKAENQKDVGAFRIGMETDIRRLKM